MMSSPKHQFVSGICILYLLQMIGTTAYGQKTGGGGGGANQTATTAQSQSGGSGSGQPVGAALPGLTFTHNSWANISYLPPPATFDFSDTYFGGPLDALWRKSFRKNVVIFCYELAMPESGTQPFVLEPVFPRVGGDSTRELCANQLRSKWKSRSLLSDRYLVFRIDVRRLPANVRERIEAVNLNATTQSGSSLNSQRGSSINPTTTRPSLALMSPLPMPCTIEEWNSLFKDDKPRGSFEEFNEKVLEQGLKGYTIAGSPVRNEFCRRGNQDAAKKPDPRANRDPDVIYLTWPGAMVGDTVSSVSINVIYTPVAPGLKWKKGVFYPAGSIISDEDGQSVVHGHYFMAMHGGVSNATPALTATPMLQAEDTTAHVLKWKDMGLVSVPTPQPWQPNHSYLRGVRVIEPLPQGQQVGQATHNYEAVHEGQSGQKPPAFSVNGSTFDDNAKSTLHWKDMGQVSIYPVPPIWTANSTYAMGFQVIPTPANGHYYQATEEGVSGTTQPAFPEGCDTRGGVGCNDDVKEFEKVSLMDAGTTLPQGAKPKFWLAGQPLMVGDSVEDAASEHYFVVTRAGIPQAASISFPIAAPSYVPAATQETGKETEWVDIGSTLPASAAAGTQPSDQNVNVLGLTFPQTQVLGRFNLASGVVVSSLIPPSISSFMSSNPGNGGACPTGVNSCTAYSQSKGSHLVDPVLGVSIYLLRPLDAERKWQIGDMVPAPTVEISLPSPTTNYHLGLSSEFARNLQLVYGVSVIQETRLSGGISTFNNAPISLTTMKKYSCGGFVGITFNITGFITSLIP